MITDDLQFAYSYCIAYSNCPSPLVFPLHAPIYYQHTKNTWSSFVHFAARLLRPPLPRPPLSIDRLIPCSRLRVRRRSPILFRVLVLRVSHLWHGMELVDRKLNATCAGRDVATARTRTTITSATVGAAATDHAAAEKDNADYNADN